MDLNTRTLLLGGAGSGSPYWILQFTSPGVSFGARGTTVTPEGQIYVTLDQGWDAYLCKVSGGGALQWARKLGDHFGAYYLGSFLDGSGNVYAFEDELYKYNANGQVQFQKSRNPYVGWTDLWHPAGDGGFIAVGSSHFTVEKFDSSLTPQWITRLTGPDLNQLGVNSVCVDQSGNIYAAGSMTIHPNQYLRGLLVKFNSSGVIQWKKWIWDYDPYEPAGGTRIEHCARDSAGNIYAAIFTGREANCILAKFSPSGSVLWQASIGGSTDVPDSMAVDPNDNVYIITRYNANGAEIFKFNSSGTLLWQRRMVNSYSGAGVGNRLMAADANSVYVAMSFTNTDDTGDAALLKLPADGSLTGSYVLGGNTLTYEVNNQPINDRNGFLTSADATLSTLANTVSTLSDVSRDSAASLTTFLRPMR